LAGIAVAATLVLHQQTADESDGKEEDRAAYSTARIFLNKVSLPTDWTVSCDRGSSLDNDHLVRRSGRLVLSHGRGR
jgi:hypothetical protein